MSKTEKTEEKTEAIVLPKGVSQETYDEVKAIIVSGFNAKQDADAIKSAIFAKGVPFSKLNRLYAIITKSEGLVVDMKKARETLTAAISNVDFTSESDDGNLTHLEVTAIVADLMEEVDGFTEKQVTATLKKHFDEQELVFPRKPAPVRGRMGAIAKTVINAFAKNKDITQPELAVAIRPVVKTEKNSLDYANQYYKMMYAASHGLTANQVLTTLSPDSVDKTQDEVSGD